MHYPRTLAAIAVGTSIVLSSVAWSADKDSVVVGLRVEPPGLDPTIRISSIISLVTLENIYEGLTRITENSEIVPQLAKSWTISPDGKTYTFKLLEGVKFSDGTAFDSADVRWTFERNGADDSTNPNKKYFAAMESIETPDAYTVVVKMNAPSSLLLYQLGWGSSAIVAPETAANNASNPVGTGPFKLDKWIKGDSITLVRNERYRDPGRVRLNRVVFRVIEDAAAQVAAIKAGDVDVFPLYSSPESVGQFKADPNIEVLVGASESEIVVGFNNSRKPFDDVRVRRAITQAIDRKAMIEGAEFGFGVPIGSHFSVNHPAYIDLTDVTPYDPEKAKELLAEAGYKDGFTTTILVPPQSFAVRGAEIAAAYLAKVGIKMKIDKRQWAQWLELVLNAKDFDIIIIDHVDPMDIQNYANPQYFYGYDSKEFQAIWRRVETALSQEEQYKAMQDAQRYLANDVPVAFMYQNRNITVKRKGLVGIWKDMPHFMADMTDVYWQD